MYLIITYTARVRVKLEVSSVSYSIYYSTKIICFTKCAFYTCKTAWRLVPKIG